MNFDCTHYVPVLKCKRGEKTALADLAESVRGRITPLIEVVELKDETVTLKHHLKKAFTKLGDAVPQGRPFFLDAREVSGLAPTAARQTFDTAAGNGLLFVPVTGISRDARETAAAMDHAERGVCLRLTRGELVAGKLTQRIGTFLLQYALTPKGVDLIMDMGPVDNMILPGVIALAEDFLRKVPSPVEWRTFTLSGTAFPKSMGVVDSNAHSLVDRLEWMVWRDRVRSATPAWPRTPTFSDCGIQHPSGVEGFDPKIMQASPTIRYACTDSWLLVKGRGGRHLRPGLQFPALARKLVDGTLRAHFAGQQHCEGCGMAKDAALGAEGLGSPEKWRRIGTAHHITTVVEQLDGLPAV